MFILIDCLNQNFIWANGQGFITEAVAKDRQTISKCLHGVIHDYCRWKMYTECILNSSNDASPTTTMRTSSRKQTANGQSDRSLMVEQLIQNTEHHAWKSEATRERTHQATGHVPPALYCTRYPHRYVFDHIFLHVNIKKECSSKTHWYR